MAKRVTKGNLWGFIQSRPYASVADIRRLFLMDVEDASLVGTSEGTYYVGLPQDAADLIRQLWYEGRIVLDTNPDVKARVVQGVYPARAPAGRRIGSQGAGDRPQGGGGSGGLSSSQGSGERPAGEVEGSGKRRRRRRRRSGAGGDALQPSPAGSQAVVTA